MPETGTFHILCGKTITCASCAYTKPQAGNFQCSKVCCPLSLLLQSDIAPLKVVRKFQSFKEDGIKPTGFPVPHSSTGLCRVIDLSSCTVAGPVLNVMPDPFLG